MKRLLIKSLALCLLAQPLLANPLMMQSMRAHQSMVVMRTVLNTQKQNAGIFNNNVQKRQMQGEVSPETIEALEKCGPYGPVIAGGFALALLIKEYRDKKRKKGPADLVVDTLEKKAQERIKNLPSHQELIVYKDEPTRTWSPANERTYPSGSVYGFDLPEGYKPGDPLVLAPQQSPVNTPTPAQATTTAQVQPSSPNPSLASTLSRDKKEDSNLDVIAGVANSGEVVQRGISNIKTLVDKVNEVTAQNAALENLGVPSGSGGGITFTDVSIITGTGAASGVVAQEVAKTTMWGMTKGAIISGGKAAWVFAAANPFTAGAAAGVVVAGAGWKVYNWWATATVEAPKNAPSLVELNEREKKVQAPAAEHKGSGSGGTPNLDPEKDPKKKDDEKSRITNTPQDLADSMKEIKKDYEWDNQRGVWKMKDNGKEIIDKVEYLKEDRLHNEIEMYDKRGRHLGALDPKTRQIKPNSQVKDRYIKI